MLRSLKARLSTAVGHAVDDEERDRLVREVARRARAARYPAKSIAATKREALRAGADEMLVRAVVQGAVDRLTAAEPMAAAEAPDPGGWYTTREAARALEVPLGWIDERLRSPEGRRLLGYPWYDGRRWHIPAPACDAKTRSEWLAGLPDSEPVENVILL